MNNSTSYWKICQKKQGYLFSIEQHNAMQYSFQASLSIASGTDASALHPSPCARQARVIPRHLGSCTAQFLTANSLCANLAFLTAHWIVPHRKSQRSRSGLVSSFPLLSSVYLMNRNRISRSFPWKYSLSKWFIPWLKSSYVLTPQQKHVAIALIDTEAIKAWQVE